MTAKEMFEELGYELIQDDMNWLIYSCNKNDWFAFNIEFNKHNYEINITGNYPSNGKVIHLTELKAINKQVEELGWDNE